MGEQGPEIIIPSVRERQPTSLPAAEESQFQTWIRGLPWYNEIMRDQGGVAPNLNDPNYDYRAAWKAGVVPQINPSDQKYHWSDFAGGQMMKSPYHPTAWAEFFMQHYGINPDDLPADDPRIVAYKAAWQRRYPPR